jgi:hypothetical protein
LNQSTNKKKSPLKISAEKRARFGSELQRDFITPKLIRRATSLSEFTDKVNLRLTQSTIDTTFF